MAAGVLSTFASGGWAAGCVAGGEVGGTACGGLLVDAPGSDFSGCGLDVFAASNVGLLAGPCGKLAAVDWGGNAGGALVFAVVAPAVPFDGGFKLALEFAGGFNCDAGAGLAFDANAADFSGVVLSPLRADADSTTGVAACAGAMPSPPGHHLISTAAHAIVPTNPTTRRVLRRFGRRYMWLRELFGRVN